MEKKKDLNRQYWLWVTRSEYYLNDDGTDKEHLNPRNRIDSGSWWTCHKDTRKGDLTLLWRAKWPNKRKSDIGYLIQAKSDAYSITDDDYASEHGWNYGCDYQSLYKFQNPISIEDFYKNPYLQDWAAYRGRFQHRVFKIPLEQWKRLNNLASKSNQGYRKFLKRILNESIDQPIKLEEELEEELVQNLGRLKHFGYNLELYTDPETQKDGRQLVCRGQGGRIDLLCSDRKKNQFVVVELKNVRAGQETFGQVFSYVGWVKKRIAGKNPVKGLVISRGYDAKFQSALNATNLIFHLDLEQLGFE